jgi:hypothetical protein
MGMVWEGWLQTATSLWTAAQCKAGDYSWALGGILQGLLSSTEQTANPTRNVAGQKTKRLHVFQAFQALAKLGFKNTRFGHLNTQNGYLLCVSPQNQTHASPRPPSRRSIEGFSFGTGQGLVLFVTRYWRIPHEYILQNDSNAMMGHELTLSKSAATASKSRSPVTSACALPVTAKCMNGKSKTSRQSGTVGGGWGMRTVSA